MIEIRYVYQSEIVDLAGKPVSEARELFQAEFGIPDAATARLNGKKIDRSLESSVILNDDDRLYFIVTRTRIPLAIGVTLMVIVCASAGFLFGFVNATTTLIVTSSRSDLASITPNTADLPTWNIHGYFLGNITGPKPVYHIDTSASGDTGDLVVCVSFSNTDELVKAYRFLALTLEMVNENDNSIIDINDDNVADENDFTVLTLNNGKVIMFPDGSIDNMTVRVRSGFYVSQIAAGGMGIDQASPELFAEVTQRGSYT